MTNALFRWAGITAVLYCGGCREPTPNVAAAAVHRVSYSDNAGFRDVTLTPPELQSLLAIVNDPGRPWRREFNRYLRYLCLYDTGGEVNFLEQLVVVSNGSRQIARDLTPAEQASVRAIKARLAATPATAPSATP